MNFAVQTQFNENGNSVTASITYIDERGGEHTYLIDEGTKAVTPPPGEFDTLTLSPSSGQFTLTFRNGVKYVFSGSSGLINTPDQNARLDPIEDPYNNRLTMGYDGSSRLTAVTDNLGIAGRTEYEYGDTIPIHRITDYVYESNGLT